jgi:hypothetical protein
MENNLPEDELKISEDKLREFLDSSQRDPDYEATIDKNMSSHLTDKDLANLIEAIHKVTQLLKLGNSAESQTERLIDILEKTVDKLAFCADAIGADRKVIKDLQDNANRINIIVYILVGLVGLSTIALLSIIVGIFIHST